MVQVMQYVCSVIQGVKVLLFSNIQLSAPASRHWNYSNLGQKASQLKVAMYTSLTTFFFQLYYVNMN